ncbi:MAG: Ankyrin repeat domain-containing protein 17 [Alyxoria varia]|nr:MAG: Ankyrin repeat domain-containing protein 17 [Alyxoria varia]
MALDSLLLHYSVTEPQLLHELRQNHHQTRPDLQPVRTTYTSPNSPTTMTLASTNPTDALIPNLDTAIHTNDPTLLTQTLTSGASPNTLLLDPRGTGALWPALRLAAYHGHAEVLRILLTHGARDPVPDRKPDLAPDALQQAAGRGHAECARLLLEAGVSDVRGSVYHRRSGRGPLKAAAADGHVETLRVLMRWYDKEGEGMEVAGQRALKSAMGNGFEPGIAAECVRVLLEGGVDARGMEKTEAEEGEGGFEFVPLRTAVESGLLEVAFVLLEFGADWRRAGVGDPAEWVAAEFVKTRERKFSVMKFE